MKIKKIMFLLGLSLCASFIAFAHPAKEVDVTVKDNNIIIIKVMHNVADPAVHYIKKIEILLNGKIILNKKFQSQTDVNEQDLTYAVENLNKGDKLMIKTKCNKFGSKNKEIVV